MERSIPLEKKGFVSWEGPLAVEEFLFLKKVHAAVGLVLVSETSKGACSTFPVVL